MAANTGARMTFFVSTLPPAWQSAAYQLHCAAHLVPWQSATFADCLTPPYFALAIFKQSEFLGYAVLMQVLDEVTLMDIAIQPAQRGQGAGKCLLQHCLQQSQQRLASTLWLEVRASNATAIALYQQHGFVLVERRYGYYPRDNGREDALIMCCHLPQ